jgi:CDP-diacylglycerol--glycerol-3-phosphate 3-phosphatidyltransferase/cardiolipin synthase
LGLYRARDLVGVPGLLSLLRVPLAILFPFVLGRPPLALFILAAAGTSDVLDGWYARRFHQVTATGSALDPVTDKIFVAAVAIALVVRGRLLPSDVILLGVRELAELPLVVWLATSQWARRLRTKHPAANVPGKLATVLQFAAVTVAILGSPLRPVLVWSTAIAGAFAAASYWLRALRQDRAARRAGI